jgi:hypothetical protein
MREDPANFAGSTFRGEALKGRSEGWLAQRQAALRGCWRRGHGHQLRVFRVVPVIP